jgi:multicomponent Na+:H+ antiporter subunit C
MSFLPFAVAAWRFMAGLYGIVSSRNLVRTILSLTVVQSATYVVLLGVGYRNGATAPIFADIPAVSKTVDPVVQVLVLTDIVIEATVSALLLALAVQAHKRFGSLTPMSCASCGTRRAGRPCTSRRYRLWSRWWRRCWARPPCCC